MYSMRNECLHLHCSKIFRTYLINPPKKWWVLLTIKCTIGVEQLEVQEEKKSNTTACEENAWNSKAPGGLWLPGDIQYNTAVSQSMRHELSIPRGAYFLNFGSTRWADTASEFRGMIFDQLKKYLTDRLIVLLWSMKIIDILQLHKRKPCSKVVIWDVKMMATLWQCTCGPSPRMQRVKSTVAFEPMREHGLWNGRIAYTGCATNTCHIFSIIKKNNRPLILLFSWHTFGGLFHI